MSFATSNAGVTCTCSAVVATAEKLHPALQQYHVIFHIKILQAITHGDQASVEQQCSVVQVKQSVAVLYHLPHILTHI